MVPDHDEFGKVICEVMEERITPFCNDNGPVPYNKEANCFCASSCPFCRAALSANSCCGVVVVVVVVDVPENGFILNVNEVPTLRCGPGRD